MPPETNVSVGHVVAVRSASATPSSTMSTLSTVLYLIRVALVSNKQTLYHISTAQISLNTISNGHLAFMKMTGDGGPPESSSYDVRECGKGKKGNQRGRTVEGVGKACP